MRNAYRWILLILILTACGTPAESEYVNDEFMNQHNSGDMYECAFDFYYVQDIHWFGFSCEVALHEEKKCTFIIREYDKKDKNTVKMTNYLKGTYVVSEDGKYVCDITELYKRSYNNETVIKAKDTESLYMKQIVFEITDDMISSIEIGRYEGQYVIDELGFDEVGDFYSYWEYRKESGVVVSNYREFRKWYNEESEIVQYTGFQKDGSYTTWQYDEEGHKVGSIFYHADTGYLTYSEFAEEGKTIQYKDGTLVSRTEYNVDGWYMLREEYDENGVLRSGLWYESKNKLKKYYCRDDALDIEIDYEAKEGNYLEGGVVTRDDVFLRIEVEEYRADEKMVACYYYSNIGELVASWECQKEGHYLKMHWINSNGIPYIEIIEYNAEDKEISRKQFEYPEGMR